MLWFSSTIMWLPILNPKKPKNTLFSYEKPIPIPHIPIPSSPCVARVHYLMSIPSLRAGPTHEARRAL